jgi:hypothetical protein
MHILPSFPDVLDKPPERFLPKIFTNKKKKNHPKYAKERVSLLGFQLGFLCCFSAKN